MEKNGFTVNPTSGNMNGVVQVSCGKIQVLQKKQQLQLKLLLNKKLLL